MARKEEKMNKKSKNKVYPSEKMLSVKISTYSKRQILKIISQRLKQKNQTVIFTPNPQMLLGAQKSQYEKILLNSADINIPDGIGIVIASRLLGGKIQNRISGIELANDILHIAQKQGYNVFLLGAEKGIAKKAKKNLKSHFPALNICGTHHGYFSENENSKIIELIRKSKADIIFVCMGYPMQEKWINENAHLLPTVKLLMGLGGTLDVWAGKTKRAPVLFQALCLEWLFRTLKEPKRARIFLDIPVFLIKVLKEKKNAPSK